MHNSTPISRRNLYGLNNKNGALAVSWNSLGSVPSVKDVYRSNAYSGKKNNLKSTQDQQKMAETATPSKLRCLKWYKMASNYILIAICAIILANRLYECLSR